MGMGVIMGDTFLYYRTIYSETENRMRPCGMPHGIFVGYLK